MSEFSVTSELVAQVSGAVGDAVTNEQVNSVLAALILVREGEPIGTKKENPETGESAKRVIENGLPVWWIIPDAGAPYRDMRPTLGAPWVEVST